MNLQDALGDWPSGDNNQSGGPWPTNPTWPGQPAANPTWPGGQPAANPTWPGSQPAGNPTWPGGQPAGNPTWPGSQPVGNPSWPGGQPAANPLWPGGQPSGNPSGPGGQPAANPTWPGGPSGGSMWPGGNPSQPTAPGGFPSGPVPAATQKSFKVPYEQKLPNGVYDKLLITITGTIKPNAEKFTLNLSTSKDIAFHFNPRFNDYGRKILVRNTCVNKIWGKEERDVRQFPFTQGQPFELKILCTNTEFKVAVDKFHILEFKHRITNLSSINTLGIYNDLTLSDVRIETLT